MVLSNQRNPNEMMIIRKIIEAGIAHAAVSFSKLIGVPVKLQAVEMEMRQCRNLQLLLLAKGDDFRALITRIQGELNGVSYFVFSYTEAEKLMQLCFPPHIRGGYQRHQQLAESILLEIDNIIAAAVITQAAEILDVFIYGDVPRMYEADNLPEQKELLGELEQESPAYELQLQTNFIIDEVNLQPSFILLLSKSFMDKVRKLKHDPQFLARLSRQQEKSDV